MCLAEVGIDPGVDSVAGTTHPGAMNRENLRRRILLLLQQLEALVDAKSTTCKMTITPERLNERGLGNGGFGLSYAHAREELQHERAKIDPRISVVRNDTSGTLALCVDLGGSYEATGAVNRGNIDVA